MSKSKQVTIEVLADILEVADYTAEDYGDFVVFRGSTKGCDPFVIVQGVLTGACVMLAQVVLGEVLPFRVAA